MIQNSLSPVVKSRISSFCGRTMSVENRSLARIWTMSCWEYFTVRAAALSASAREGAKADGRKVSNTADSLTADFNVIGLSTSVLLVWLFPNRQNSRGGQWRREKETRLVQKKSTGR